MITTLLHANPHDTHGIAAATVLLLASSIELAPLQVAVLCRILATTLLLEACIHLRLALFILGAGHSHNIL